jgi:3-phenylpropionate/cinnamic acid dioxygenase small subunit
MTIDLTTPHARTAELTALLSREARLLDQHEHVAWLELLDEALRYWAPVRSNVDREGLEAPNLLVHFDEGKAELAARLGAATTGLRRRPRVRRLVTNVLVLDETPEWVELASSLLVTVSDDDHPMKVHSAGREDRWVHTAGTWRLRARRLLLDSGTAEGLSAWV